MRSPRRVAFGVLIGAFFALAFAPFTRTLLFAGAYPWGQDRTISDTSPLSSDPGPAESAAWVQTWARRVDGPEAPTANDYRKITAVIAHAQQIEPENAYWYQAQALILYAQDKNEEALKAWREGAKRGVWRDYQHETIMQRRARIDPEGHGWSYALIYGASETTVLERMQLFARYVVRGAPTDTPNGLNRRMETLRNGELIRRFARSVAVGEYGVAMVELAAYPPDLAPIRNPSKLILARMAFHDQLENSGRDIDAEAADRAYRANDGWTAFASSEAASQNAANLSMGVLLATCLPGSLLWAAAFGALLYGLGVRTARSDEALNTWRLPWCAVIGIGLGLAVGFITQSPLAGLSLTGAFGFLAWRPTRIRHAADMEFGPLFGLLLFVEGGLLTIASAALAMGVSRIGWSLAARLPVPPEYFGGAPTVCGFVAISLGCIIALGPAYGWAYRIDPARIVARSLMLVGGRMAAFCFVFAVFATPFALYVDRTLGDEIRQISTNEPLYYLSP